MTVIGLSFDVRTLLTIGAALALAYGMTRLLFVDKAAYASLVGPRKDEAEEDELDDAEVDNMHAWSITARLAHIAPEELEQIPDQVAALIAEAKSLHPKVAEGVLRGIG